MGTQIITAKHHRYNLSHDANTKCQKIKLFAILWSKFYTADAWLYLLKASLKFCKALAIVIGHFKHHRCQCCVNQLNKIQDDQSKINKIMFVHHSHRGKVVAVVNIFYFVADRNVFWLPIESNKCHLTPSPATTTSH